MVLCAQKSRRILLQEFTTAMDESAKFLLPSYFFLFCCFGHLCRPFSKFEYREALASAASGAARQLRAARMVDE